MATFSASAAVGEVLRQPDDLVKLSAFRNKLLKEKATLDAKLQEGVRSQLDATRDALLKLQESRAAVAAIREEMIEVEKLKRDKDEGEVFEKITRVSGVHRNFTQTAKMVNELQSMADKVNHLGALLEDDRAQSGGPIGPSPNLLPIHFELQKLETFRNETMHEAKRGSREDKAILARWFEPLDLLTHAFESWLWEISANMIENAGAGYGGTVVRLLKIIEFESKEDEKAVALRLVRKVAANDAASNFRSMQANARVIKNYRHKMLDAMEGRIKSKFEAEWDGCRGDDLAFIHGLDEWLFADVVRIKDDLESLFPEDFNVVEWYIKRYHRTLNGMLTRIVEAGPDAQVLLQLHAWIKKYRQTMKGEVPIDWLSPPLLDGRAQDLIEDYVKLIITKLDEWTINLQKEETSKFRLREAEPQVTPEGLFGMDGVVDFFQLVNQQIDLSLESNQGAVLARVVTECGRVMHRVQHEWTALVASELRLSTEKRPEEVAPGLVEYTMALANDQLRAADYTEALQARLEPLVSDKYRTTITERLNEAIDGYLDAAKRCTNTLVEFVFNDLRPATSKLFTPEWYSGALSTSIIATMGDYMSDYQAHLNGSLFDLLIDDMLDAFLITYLTALRRAPAKSLRMPKATDRLTQDVGQAFDLFQNYRAPQDIEASFEIMKIVGSMLDASSEMFVLDWHGFARVHGPQLAFTEALLRARDDLDRGDIADIMDALRRRVTEEGLGEPEEPTIMVRIHGHSGAAGLIRNIATYADNVAGRMRRRD
ncbi:exocyst complex component Sec6 [Cutaneotrichosporon oleaginosum]|uniref:Exocyst complex component Sec6 n=1 Tax=Cutaneotrichosporon oleaginosum TaxID=879819 RepID=A0A0J0XHS5_9TREE|nr:exocyst complex component Sec6 [Cutaneotrichosporon oleaginosum]KLT40656.1 exocyst complex component Sec6 [Cutaneotrichosporon oleaginosum]TXT12466.1 hypothetical protein COLE_02876 [Cutaneotrichosporon oleaginosum]